ncbi:Hypothetical protein LUCI_3543 [Lucifera butyrica]|uniref:histidine kinase n=1 Tax=Lucifera butyrica TaxID=1351585 RepID=A0A498RDR4_9FIRM|nr:HAMP domain-containing sensor histidine kinase [Lucifera butyrica]VBB08272.1 Hypothetical protein LUCI_3543 [Lucifera butyrica]
MGIRDLSVRRRLMFSNFMMIFIPVLLILIIGTSVLLGLRLTGNMRRSEIALLWPEIGPTLSIQLAVSSLREQVNRSEGPKMRELREACQALEEQGIQVAVVKGGEILYVTQGCDASTVMTKLDKRYTGTGAVFLWNESGFAFRYESTKRAMIAVAVGNVPFLARGGILESIFKNFLTIIAFVVVGITVFIIVVTGVFLSRRLSKQLIKPIEELSHAAGEISRGNLDYAIPTEGKDELGAACREFDQMRMQLKAAREVQERYEKNRKELIVGISHDLSTPLTSIKGYTSGLLDGIAKTAEKKEHYLNMIYQTTCNMEKLVESLFLFSKLDLGRVEFCLEAVRLQDYLTDYVAENADRLLTRGLRLTLNCQSVNSQVRIDRIQFQRVVENLVENSLKYKRGEVGNLTISLKNEAEGQLRLEFADDGKGVAAPELSKLFDSFYRTDQARTNVGKGSGLGLAIVKQIITTMQGEIWAENGENGGLTICILLPIAGEERA